MAFNPMVVILKENKLVEPNYIDWKRNLDTVLTVEECKYVLIEHQFMPSAYDIMQNLKEMFGDQNPAGKGTPIRDHVLKMIGLLNELEILGDEIDVETQFDIVLQSLPDSFKYFCMNKLSYSLAELLKELQAA
ncbi:uncharacterized protein LOC131148275 [Malania oleifera]|uniref:uncharacterized protein LOC131148275 n=1 Tax=Malania oleifera TaxID=397392 RepID=UPI0025AEC017|nr:uncharacterized protein LOC131148275 [Malania oleifera]